MAKPTKTKDELEKMIMAEAKKAIECRDLTGVTVHGLADDRVPYNWSVGSLHNSSGDLCDQEVARIAAGLQTRFDLAI